MGGYAMDFIGCIKETFSGLKQPAYHELKSAIESLNCSKEKVSFYATKPEKLSYGRTVLFLTDELEVVLINMPAKEQTLLHDHGESIGCVYVVEGELENLAFALEENERPAFLSENRVREGEFLEVTEGLIHILRNSSEQRFLSFHVYSPPLTAMKNYEYKIENSVY
jgi:cysteine dioxygenase